MTTTIIFALMAFVGVYMVSDALTPPRPRVHLTERDQRPMLQRSMDTFFTPAAQRVITIGRGNTQQIKLDLATRLARANYPSPFSDPETTPDMVIGYQLLIAVVFAVLGGLFGLSYGLGSASLFVVLALAAAGWFVPLQVIQSAENIRREQLMLDAASTMDRLASFVAAGNTLPAAVRSLAERPGGAWVGEFRKIASAYAVGGDFGKALDEAMEQSGRMPEIVRVCERLRAAHEMGGGGVIRALRQMAGDARSNVKNLITRRGYENAIYMLAPAFLAILATAIILIAPGAIKMMSVLAG